MAFPFAQAQQVKWPLTLQATSYQVRFPEGVGNWTVTLSEAGKLKNREMYGNASGLFPNSDAAALMLLPEDSKNNDIKTFVSDLGLKDQITLGSTVALFMVQLPPGSSNLMGSYAYQRMVCVVKDGKNTGTLKGEAYLARLPRGNITPAQPLNQPCYVTPEAPNTTNFVRKPTPDALGWPIEMKAGQDWNLVIRPQLGEPSAKWNLQINTVNGNNAVGQATGVTNAPVEFQYFPPNHPQYPNTLAMQIGRDNDPNANVCLFSFTNNGYTPDKTVIGKVMVGQTLCILTLGKGDLSQLGSTTPPAWLTSAKKQPYQGGNWTLEMFGLTYRLNFDKQEKDGWSGKATLTANSNPEKLPPDWQYRLVWLGQTIRLQVTLGAVNLTCQLQEQYQNAQYGSLSGDATLTVNGQSQDNPCRVTLNL